MMGSVRFSATLINQASKTTYPYPPLSGNPNPPRASKSRFSYAQDYIQTLQNHPEVAKALESTSDQVGFLVQDDIDCCELRESCYFKVVPMVGGKAIDDDAISGIRSYQMPNDWSQDFYQGIVEETAPCIVSYLNKLDAFYRNSPVS